MSKENELVSIGYGAMVSAGRLIAVVGPDSAPVKRLIAESRERSMLIDATFGRKTAAVLVIVLDCVMTFFGSSANDAAFNAWVTDVTDDGNRGRVEAVLAVMPLVAMLVVFGALDGLTTQGKWGSSSSSWAA